MFCNVAGECAKDTEWVPLLQCRAQMGMPMCRCMVGPSIVKCCPQDAPPAGPGGGAGTGGGAGGGAGAMMVK